MSGLGLLNLKSIGLISNKNTDSNQITESYTKNYSIDVSQNSVIGSYTYDLNILELNDCCLHIIDAIKIKKLEMLEKLKSVETYKIGFPQYTVDRNTSIKLLEKINAEIIEFNNNTKKFEYIFKVSPILNEYKTIGILKKYITFGKGLQMTHSENSEKKLLRFSIIERFLDIARKYVDLNIYRKSTCKGCVSCGYDISSLESSENENIICPNCNIEITDISGVSSDSGVTKKSTYNYEGRINFINELHRFQGNPGKSKIPTNLLEILDNHFITKGFPTRKHIKNNPSLLKKTSKDLMYVALKAIDMSSLYKDINLICNIYWGYDLINLENCETQIMEKYDLIDKVYEEIKDDRSSSLNTQYELCWILTMIKFPCSPSDFKLPKTVEIFNYHEKMRERICTQLGWSFVALNYISI